MNPKKTTSWETNIQAKQPKIKKAQQGGGLPIPEDAKNYFFINPICL